MARITLNVAQDVVESATGGGFDPVPKGKHTVTVFEVKNQVSSAQAKTPGAPQINVQFRIADGHPHANRRVFKLFNCYGEKPYDTINFFKALGYDYEEITQTGIDTDDLLGRELQITIDHEEKKTKESGYKESFDPKEYRERITGYRNLESVEVSGQAKVAAGGTAQKATSTGAKFTL